jgi:hypothetical protein
MGFMWRLAAAVALCAVMSSTAWALFDLFEARCTSSDHGRKGWELLFPDSDAGEAAACKAAAQHLIAYPRHKANVFFKSDNAEKSELWDCANHRAASRR